MPRWSSALVTVSLVLSAGLIAQAEQGDDPPRSKLRIRFDGPGSAPTSPPGFVGGTIAVDDEGLWVAERVPGVLIRTDLEGKPKASLSLHPGLGQLVHDAERAGLFVADRGGDRVLRIASSAAGEPSIARELEIREPYGLALTADGETLLVTSVADHELVAVDSQKLEILWRVQLRPEPRGVAVSADGKRAIVGFLSSGALAEIDLASRGEKVRWHALDPRDQVEVETVENDFEEEESLMTIEEANSRFEVPNDVGRRHARNVFAVAFVGDVVVAPHQVATPQIKRRPQAGLRDKYGGGDVPPIVYQLARIDPPPKVGASEPSFVGSAVDQPRALAWDAQRDILWVGGYGSDTVEMIANASRSNASADWAVGVDEGCGVDGVAPTSDGTGVWVHCELTRSLVRIGLDGEKLRKSKDWLRSGELVASPRSPEAEWGAELFRRNGDTRISGEGVLACANCHPEGRNDGLSWRLGNSILQTPMLAGRVVGTGPYKWDGQDVDLRDSIRHTVERLGGEARQLRRSEIAALEAYLLSLPDPRPPSVRDAEAVTRGKAVFEQECSGCHAGDRSTDQNQHALTTSLKVVDTPSLMGLAHTAPYYHDGSATDLRTLLDDRATIHDMTDTSGLSDAQRKDLVAYLESL
jgi:mono/diheme cytochrome c family protein